MTRDEEHAENVLRLAIRSNEDAAWQLADRLRAMPRSPDSIVNALAKSPEHQNWETVAMLTQIHGIESFVSRNWARLLVALLAGRAYKKHLDPWAGMGVLIAALLEAKVVSHAIAIERNASHRAIADMIADTNAVEWIASAPIDWLLSERQVADFDLVTAATPVGLATQSITVGELTLKDAAESLVLALAARSMAQTGDCFAFVPDGFFSLQHRGRGAATLEAAGLHVAAAISLPATWNPVTSIPFSLVLIRREAPPDGMLWVGRAGENGWESLRDNFWARTVGRTPELGALIDAKEYRGWSAYSLGRTLEATVRALPYPGVTLRELAVAWHLGRAGKVFEHEENSLYLPIIGNSPAVTEPDALAVKQQNVIQIVLDPSKASAAFVAGFLNSQLGRQIRARMMSGGIISKANTETALAAKAYLPSLDKQVAVMGVDSQIREMTAALLVHERELWAHPIAAEKVAKALKHVGERDELRMWLSTLPFPLASILWTYRAARDPTKQKEHLLHFFEALAEFVVAVHLSALTSNPQFFESHADRILGEDRDDVDLLKRSSFGTWTTLGLRLAASIRRIGSNTFGADLVKELFRAADGQWIEALVAKDLFASLVLVGAYRNDWKGHGGHRERH